MIAGQSLPKPLRMLMHTGSLEPAQFLIHNSSVEERMVQMDMDIEFADRPPAPVEVCRVEPVVQLNLKVRNTP